MSPSTEIRENREFASEIKFLVTPALAGQIRDWARARLDPDPNASGDSREAHDFYQITSIYFDTARFDVFHRKGSFARSKYRVRRYGASDVAFLERKLKTRGLLTKRRSLVRLGELERLLDQPPERGWAGQWFHRRLLARRLRPICEITYRRTARVAMTGYGPIRMTLDEDIRAVAAHNVAFNGVNDGKRLSERHVIVELKYRLEMPVLFKLLVEEFALNPQPVSKYRLAAVALGYVSEPARKESAGSAGHAGAAICQTF